MSLDWLTLNPAYTRGAPVSSSNLPFVLLEHEVLTYASPDRVSLHLSPTNLQNETTRSRNGTVYLTNKRLVYVSDNTYAAPLARDRSVDFDNFVLLINRNIYGFRMINSWFGSNKFSLVFKPTLEGAGLNHMYVWNMVLHFNNGGMFEFDAKFQEAYNQYKYNQDVAEQLPRYEE